MIAVGKNILIITIMIFIVNSVAGCKPLSAGMTFIPTPTKLVPMFSFKDITVTSRYLQDCRDIYSTANYQQIGYRDIYPGKTTIDQVAKIYGQSRKYSFDKTYEEWIIDGPNQNLLYTVSASNNLVDYVFVRTDQEILLSLKELLKKFGCPEVIIAVELEPSIDTSTFVYNTTFFVYLTNGIEIRFEGFPVSYSSPASIITFERPYDLEEYLTNVSFSVEAASPVTLDEAVVETK